jgi:hypothetical protein
MFSNSQIPVQSSLSSVNERLWVFSQAKIGHPPASKFNWSILSSFGSTTRNDLFPMLIYQCTQYRRLDDLFEVMVWLTVADVLWFGQYLGKLLEVDPARHSKTEWIAWHPAKVEAVSAWESSWWNVVAISDGIASVPCWRFVKKEWAGVCLVLCEEAVESYTHSILPSWLFQAGASRCQRKNISLGERCHTEQSKVVAEKTRAEDPISRSHLVVWKSVWWVEEQPWQTVCEKEEVAWPFRCASARNRAAVLLWCILAKKWHMYSIGRLSLAPSMEACMSCPSLCSPSIILVRVFGGRFSDLFLGRHKHLFQILSFLIFCFNLGDNFTQVWYILLTCQILNHLAKRGSCGNKTIPPLVLFVPLAVAIDVIMKPVVGNVRKHIVFPWSGLAGTWKARLSL